MELAFTVAIASTALYTYNFLLIPIRQPKLPNIDSAFLDLNAERIPLIYDDKLTPFVVVGDVLCHLNQDGNLLPLYRPKGEYGTRYDIMHKEESYTLLKVIIGPQPPIKKRYKYPLDIYPDNSRSPEYKTNILLYDTDKQQLIDTGVTVNTLMALYITENILYLADTERIFKIYTENGQAIRLCNTGVAVYSSNGFCPAPGGVVAVLSNGKFVYIKSSGPVKLILKKLWDKEKVTLFGFSFRTFYELISYDGKKLSYLERKQILFDLSWKMSPYYYCYIIEATEKKAVCTDFILEYKESYTDKVMYLEGGSVDVQGKIAEKQMELDDRYRKLFFAKGMYKFEYRE
jgi:hypothetical protein